MMQVLLPVYQNLAQATGNVDPLNALIRHWCQALDIEPGPFLIQLAPPPLAQPTGPPGSGPGVPGAGGGPQASPAPACRRGSPHPNRPRKARRGRP
jgi:hypothetical protein